MKTPVITLTSDFGLKDPFAGIMRGVILGINREAEVVDITHGITRHDIFGASRTLAMSHRYFPSNTIHIVVVDPGVGGSRKPLLVMNGEHYFIGPDNGVFSSIYDISDPNMLKVYHLTASHYFLSSVGATFHGRDIFAPVAAWLSRGVDSSRFGDTVDDYVHVSIPKPVLLDNVLQGLIMSVDIFGNAATNITYSDIQKLGNLKLSVKFKNQNVKLFNYYSENAGGHLGAVINSFEHLELFMYMDNAAGQHSIREGDSVSVVVE